MVSQRWNSVGWSLGERESRVGGAQRGLRGNRRRTVGGVLRSGLPRPITADDLPDRRSPGPRRPPRRRESQRESAAYHQLTAFITSAPILASSVAVNSFSAKATGHMAPSSRFAASLKPNVAYLVLNFCALWKKQKTLPSLAYAGIPYQSLGERAGALALMIAWSRFPIARSGSGILPIFARTAFSPSAVSARGPRRAAALSSWMRSFIATRSSSVNPLNFPPIAVVRLADFCGSFLGLVETYSY